MKSTTDDFPQRLRRAMDEANLTASALATEVGVSSTAVSYYLSGRMKPTAFALVKISQVTGVSMDYLLGLHGEVPAARLPDRVSVTQAARLMHKDEHFVRAGLMDGTLPFGAARKNGERASFYISPGKLRDYVGGDVFDRFFGGQT